MSAAAGRTREPLSVRLSRAVLAWAVRGRAARDSIRHGGSVVSADGNAGDGIGAAGSDWGEAMLSELDQPMSAAERVRWALSSAPVAWRERRRRRAAQRSPRVRAVRRAAFSVASVVIGAFLLNVFVATIVYEPAEAMEPSYTVSSRVLVDKVGFRMSGLRHGDVVVVDLPRPYNAENRVITRVLGLPGDRMACDASGSLTRNGTVVVTAPASGQAAPRCAAVTVADGDVYIVGDNFLDALDSRTFGAVSQSAVAGRVVTQVWPL